MTGTRGLTLLELVVAVFVLALGSIAALGAMDQARVGLGQERARLLAGIVAANRVEELRLLGPQAATGLPGAVQMGGQDFRISQMMEATAGGLLEATVTVRAEAGAGVVLVTYLSPRARPGG